MYDEPNATLKMLLFYQLAFALPNISFDTIPLRISTNINPFLIGKHICAHLGECYVNLRYAWLNVLAFAEQPVKHVN